MAKDSDPHPLRTVFLSLHSADQYARPGQIVMENGHFKWAFYDKGSDEGGRIFKTHGGKWEFDGGGTQLKSADRKILVGLIEGFDPNTCDVGDYGQGLSEEGSDFNWQVTKHA